MVLRFAVRNSDLKLLELKFLLHSSKDPLVPVPDFKREEQPEVREIVKQEVSS